MHNGSPFIGLSAHRACLADDFVPLAELDLISTPDTLAGFGFTGAHVCRDIAPLAQRAAAEVLRDAGVAPVEVGALLWASALPQGHQRTTVTPATLSTAGQALNQFCYQGSWLQEELGLERAFVSGVA